MNQSAPNVQNINQYHEHFRDTAQYIRTEPRVDRNCNDKCCYIFFIFLTIAFISVGCYYITQANIKEAIAKYQNNQSYSDPSYGSGSGIQIENLKNGIGIVGGMILLSIALAFLFLLLLIKFPKPMFYAMIVLAFLAMACLMIAAFIFKQYVLGGIIAVMMLVYGCVLFCLKDRIKQGIILLHTASSFLAAKPSVFIAPFFILIFVLLFETFWLGGLMGIALKEIQAQTDQQLQARQGARSGLYFLWIMFQIFYSTFFYYCLVFLIATACAMWYYNIQGFFLFTGFKRIVRYHTGSFTFAAFLVTLVTMARQSAQNQRDQSSGACFVCFCLISCCLSIIEDLLETLNHNAIIVMSVTGQSYIDSAKSTLSLIFQNFGLFFLVDIISGLARFSGTLFICGLPALIGFILLNATAENQNDIYTIMVGVMAILFVSFLIGGLLLGVLSEALSCVFIFYCFDLKFQSMGFSAADQVPSEMKTLLREMNPSHKNYQNSYGQNNNNNGYDERPQGNYESLGPYGYGN